MKTGGVVPRILGRLRRALKNRAERRLKENHFQRLISDPPKRTGGIKRKMPSLGALTLMIVGVLCLLYCFAIGLFVGYGTRFFYVWGALGIFLAGIGYLIGCRNLLHYLPGWMKVSIAALVCVGAFLFLLVEGLILSKFWSKAMEGADYCIVLGAQMKENGPSEVLRRRLDKAVSYLEANPDTIVIVSGGKGENEPVSEAQGMYEYLTGAGIAPGRIRQEDLSVNTFSNLEYSAAFLNKKEDTVVIITNNFHVFRAMSIAKKLGYEKNYGLAASSTVSMLPNNMLREFFGIVKDFLVGNI